MFSLIVVIISIALVITLVAATLYSGGDMFSQGKDSARAARITSQAQQITIASDAFNADQSRFPDSIQELIDAGYLSSWPSASISPKIQVLANAYALTETPWTIPVPGVPALLLEDAVTSAVCREVNAQGSLAANGISRYAHLGLTIQCYLSGSDQLNVLVAKNAAAILAVVGSAQQGKPSGSDWYVEPSTGSGTAPEEPGYPGTPPTDPEPPVTPDPEPEPEPEPVRRYELSRTSMNFGDIAVGQSEYLTVSVRNHGDVRPGPMQVSVAEPFMVFGNGCSSLAPGDDCSITIRYTPTSTGEHVGLLSITPDDYETLTVSLTGNGAVDGHRMNISVSNNPFNFNLRNVALASGWDGVKPLEATVTVEAGTLVGSATTGSYAWRTGTGFPEGSKLTLINNGSILGRGGNGGEGGSASQYGVFNGEPGHPGGPALLAEHPITIVNNGVIGGGGQGGKGGNGQALTGPGFPIYVGAAGGGGGQGYSGGNGGALGTGSNGGNGVAGNPGSPTAPGAAIGQANAHSNAAGGPLGNGAAVSGNSHITWQATGTRHGAVN